MQRFMLVIFKILSAFLPLLILSIAAIILLSLFVSLLSLIARFLRC